MLEHDRARRAAAPTPDVPDLREAEDCSRGSRLFEE
jgi:hypothetical protein